MPRGKGNKLYDIPSKKAKSRTELMTALAVVPPQASLVLWSGEQQKMLAWKDLQEYVGERAQRGAVVKRGWPRKITRMEAILPTVAGGS
jgi:topoisomerase-4 subunit A